MKKILHTLKNLPWYYLLLGMYPFLFIWSNNKTEIDPSIVLRPLLFTLLGVILFYVLLFLVFRNPPKTSLVGSFLLILFFSYGHIYYWLREITSGGLISRHRFLGPVYLVLCLVGVFLLVKYGARWVKYQRVMNLISLVLVFIPLTQLGYYYVASAIASRQPLEIQSDLHITPGQPLPDVYYIILDTYMRADALEQSMGYDNSPFIQELKDLGFYVAACSRPNYEYTQASLASALNMEYLPALERHYENQDEGDNWADLKNNKVRQQLEGAGYTTVSFLTAYKWSEWKDADIYLGPGLNIIGASLVQPFEAMYLKSTAFIVANDFLRKIQLADEKNVLSGIDFPYQYRANLQFFILNQLPSIPLLPGHKFVFVHMIIPHVPYIYSPTGEILTDTGYYGGDFADAIDDNYRKQGYVYAVQFINSRLVPILRTIIEKSTIPPIIILQGDHGLRGENRATILNAYYLPDGYADLYPSITPVNSFRTILDEYFGAQYPLLPDMTFSDNGEVKETYPDCLP